MVENSQSNEILYQRFERSLKKQFPKEERRGEILELIRGLHQFLFLWFQNPATPVESCKEVKSQSCAFGKAWHWNFETSEFSFEGEKNTKPIFVQVSGNQKDQSLVLDFHESKDRSDRVSQNELKLFFSSCDHENE